MVGGALKDLLVRVVHEDTHALLWYYIFIETICFMELYYHDETKFFIDYVFLLCSYWSYDVFKIYLWCICDIFIMYLWHIYDWVVDVIWDDVTLYW